MVGNSESSLDDVSLDPSSERSVDDSEKRSLESIPSRLLRSRKGFGETTEAFGPEKALSAS